MAWTSKITVHSGNQYCNWYNPSNPSGEDGETPQMVAPDSSAFTQSSPPPHLGLLLRCCRLHPSFKIKASSHLLIEHESYSYIQFNTHPQWGRITAFMKLQHRDWTGTGFQPRPAAFLLCCCFPLTLFMGYLLLKRERWSGKVSQSSQLLSLVGCIT